MDAVERLVKDGSVVLTGMEAMVVLAVFNTISQGYREFDFKTVPSAIGGNSVRGSFSREAVSLREGLYYGPECDAYLGDRVGDLRLARKVLTGILDTWFERVVKRYGLDAKALRGDGFDTLTIARYFGGEGVALGDHTDFGLLTLGVTTGDGLQFRHGDNYVDIPPWTVFLHTGSWLQRALRDKVQCDPAVHRVVNTADRRVFMGLFYDPAPTVALNGETFAEFIDKSLKGFYGDK